MSVLAFLALALGTQPAHAGDADCSSCSIFSGTLQSLYNITDAPISGSDWTGTFSERIYLDPGTGVYSYVFDFHVTTAGTDVFTNSTGVGQPQPGANYFDTVGLNYGVVTAGGPLTPTSGGVDDTGFTPIALPGTSATLKTGSNVSVGQNFEFYAQSMGTPGDGEFTFQDGGVSETNSFDPTPEPRSILLFGTGFLTLAFLLRRRLPQLPQPL